MLEKLNHLARAAAINVARRQFLGNLGQAALGAAAGLAGLLLVGPRIGSTHMRRLSSTSATVARRN